MCVGSGLGLEVLAGTPKIVLIIGSDVFANVDMPSYTEQHACVKMPFGTTAAVC